MMNIDVENKFNFFQNIINVLLLNRTSLANYLNFEDIYHIIKIINQMDNLYCLCASYGCDLT